VSAALLLVLAGALAYISWEHTAYLSDKNSFLEDFLDSDFLSFLGLVLTISVASMAQLNLTLTGFEKENDGLDLSDVKAEIRNTAACLIALFVLALILVLLKPIAAVTDFEQAVFNSLAVLLIGVYLAILTDVTLAVFSL
jgi:hypothetical protein